MADPIPLPWQPPTALAPTGVPLALISPALLAKSVGDYLVPAIFCLQGASCFPLGEMAGQLATLRLRLLAHSDR
jgi:hypothetical protein